MISETAEQKLVRGKAECTSAAVEMLGTRNAVDELVLEFASIEK